MPIGVLTLSQKCVSTVSTKVTNAAHPFRWQFRTAAAKVCGPSLRSVDEVEESPDPVQRENQWRKAIVSGLGFIRRRFI